MQTLETLLAGRTVRDMQAIARNYDLPFNNRRLKPTIQSQLREQLTTTGRLRRTLAALPPSDSEALRTLQAAGGRLSAQQFTLYFGPIRPYRPWANKVQPWKRPESVAERLWYLGIIGTDGEQMFLCEEALASLPPLPLVHPVDTDNLTSEATPAALLYDVTAFLGALTYYRAQVQHGRWLSPRLLHAIHERFSVPDDSLDQARSERQTRRLRFIHYLAEVSGLVGVVNGALKPTLQAESWLQQAPDQQLSVLMDSIQRDLGNRTRLWDTFGLPAVSPKAWQHLVDQIAALDAGRVYAVEALTESLRLYVPDLTAETVVALGKGPLTGLGQIALSEDARYLARITDAPHAAFASCVETPSALVIHLPNLPDRSALYTALAWLKPDRAVLRIDAHVIRRATECGATALTVAEVVRRLTGQPMSEAAFQRLQTWERAAYTLQIEHVAVLTSPNAELLSQLYGDRQLRPLFEKPLLDHALAIRPEAVDTLEARLARRQLGPTVLERPESGPDVGGLASQSYLAMRVYQALSGIISLPVAIPGAISDELKALLSRKEISQIEQMAQSVTDALQGALQGRAYAFAPSPVADDSLAVVQTAIERAYESRSTLTIDYFSPAQGIVTRRTIEPLLPIRWQGDIGYVEAWCQLDDAPRTFRLDRILRIIDS